VKPSGAERALVPVALALAALGASLAFAYWPLQLDDAAITFRYAWNAVHGQLAYTPGAPAAEGFSSPGWLLALTAAAAIGGKGAIAPTAAALGLLSFFGVFIALAVISRRLAPAKGVFAPVVTMGILLLVATCPTFHYYALTGMETNAFALVIVLATGAALGALPLWLGVTAAVLLPWVRPEAPLMIGVLALVALRHPDRRRAALLMAGVLFSSALVLTAARWAAFHDFVANTGRAKPPSFEAGLTYVQGLLLTVWALGFVVLGGLGAVRARGAALTAWLAGLLWLGGAALEGGDWMPQLRFGLPALVCMLLACSGLAAMQNVVVRIVAGVVALAAVGSEYASSAAQAAQMNVYRRGQAHESVALREWMQKAGISSVALMDIGVIGFEGEFDIVDLAGLTDRHIASAPGHHLEKQLDVAYVLEQRHPDVVVIRVSGFPFPGPNRIATELAFSAPERQLIRDPRLAEGYRLEFSLFPDGPRDPFYGRLVYVRRDFQLPEAARPPSPIVYVSPLSDDS
jgi:hypothetical protein